MLATPGMAETLGGNLAARATEALLSGFAGRHLFAREVTAVRMAELRAELAGPAPTPVERLLAERAVACWLHLAHLEMQYASKGSHELRTADYYQKAIDRAHNRYLSALRTLATVRRLAVPPVQVNIARKQVNVAAS